MSTKTAIKEKTVKELTADQEAIVAALAEPVKTETEPTAAVEQEATDNALWTKIAAMLKARKPDTSPDYIGPSAPAPIIPSLPMGKPWEYWENMNQGFSSMIEELCGPLPTYKVDSARVAKMAKLRQGIQAMRELGNEDMAAAGQAQLDLLEAAGVSAAQANHTTRQGWYTHAYSTLVDLLKVHAATSETHISFGPVSRNVVSTSTAPKPVKEKTGETPERVRGERGINLAEVVRQAYLAEKTRYEISHVNHQFPGLTREQVEESVKAVGRSSSVSWPTVLKLQKVAGSSPKVYRPIN